MQPLRLYSELLNQKLHCNKILRWQICTLALTSTNVDYELRGRLELGLHLCFAHYFGGLGRSYNFFKPQNLHLQDGENNSC